MTEYSRSERQSTAAQNDRVQPLRTTEYSRSEDIAANAQTGREERDCGDVSTRGHGQRAGPDEDK